MTLRYSLLLSVWVDPSAEHREPRKEGVLLEVTVVTEIEELNSKEADLDVGTCETELQGP